MNLFELVKFAKEAGLSPSNINELIAKEEEIFAQQLERIERQRMRYKRDGIRSK